MQNILRLGENLYIDLESGRCRNTLSPLAGADGQKLTHGQLKILSYMVENREHVCEISVLEGLFDDSLRDTQTAGIKQQILRIKNKLKSVDSSFDSQRAKNVFQSIPRVGYLFHLPEDGEIIEMRSPADALQRLDARWMEGIRKTSGEEQRIIQGIFDRMDPSWENTLRASALGMCVQIADMRRLLNDFYEFVFMEDGKRGLVTVTSVGVEGKTVLLAEFARRCIEEHPNWNVFVLDLNKVEISAEAIRELFHYVVQSGISRLHRCLLLLDNPPLFDKRFSFFLEEIQKRDQQWLYIVMTKRLFTLTLAFDQPYLPGFREKTRILMLDPLLAEKQKRMSNRTFYVREPDGSEKKVEIDQEIVKKIMMQKGYLTVLPPASVKKEVMAKIAGRKFSKGKEEQEKTGEILQNLRYEKSSYVELYLTLFARSIQMDIDEQEGMADGSGCLGHTVWKDWRTWMRFLDQDCSGERKLTEMFPYMAVMWIFGIPVTAEFLFHATGCKNQGFYWMLDRPVGNTLWLEGERIHPPGREVLYAYFYLNPQMSPEGCLLDLLRNSWLDRGTLQKVIEKTFLHYMHIDLSTIPFGVDLLKLAKATKNNPIYMRMLKDDGNADIPVLAEIWLSYEPEVFQGTLSRTAITFSSAFYSLILEEERKLVQVKYWLHFLETSLYYFDNVPDFLMNYFVDQDEELQEKMLTGVENDYQNGSYYREKHWGEMLEVYLQELRLAAAGQGLDETDQTASITSVKGTSPENMEEEEKSGRENTAKKRRLLLKDRLLNALLWNRRKQRQYLAKIAAEEKSSFSFGIPYTPWILLMNLIPMRLQSLTQRWKTLQRGSTKSLENTGTFKIKWRKVAMRRVYFLWQGGCPCSCSGYKCLRSAGLFSCMLPIPFQILWRACTGSTICWEMYHGKLGRRLRRRMRKTSITI